MWAYPKQILIALDQLLNTIFRGYADETLSSRAWRHYAGGSRKWPKRLIDAVLFFDKNHCEESYKSEILRRQLPPSMREKNAQ